MGHPGGPDNLCLDIESYMEVEEKGGLLSFILEDENKVVAYCTIYLFNHPHYTHLEFAATDSFYFLPSHRNGFTIKRFFKEIEVVLSNKYNVEYFQIGINSNNDVSRLLQLFDFQISSKTFTKKIR